MSRATQSNGGRTAGLLLMAAGAFTIVNDYLPGSELLDVALLNAVGLVALCSGAVAYVLPWHRWHPRASLALGVFAFALIAVSDRYGGVSPYSYAVYFVVVFVWVGIAHPPRTSWLMAPAAAAAYVLPFALTPGAERGGIPSASVAIPVCVLVGETIARTVRRQAHAQAALADRARRVERLADLVGELNADLDPDAVLPRICHSARELLDANAAGFVTATGGVASIRAAEALPASLVGASWPVDGSSMAEVLRTREPLVVTDFSLYPHRMAELTAAVPGLHTLLVIPSVGQGEVRGALYTLFAQPGRHLTAAEIDVATLLAGHAGAALANAATHAEVVRARDHEQAVIDGMADGMAVLGPDGAVSAWNAAAAALTGLPAAAVTGGPLPFPVGPPRVPTDHRLPDGRWIEVLTSPLDGETVVGFRDITKAKALDEAKDLFLATTSHELRTPITVIKGYVAVLAQSWQRLTDTERGDALAAVADRTDALVALVDHLLLGARAGAARYSLETAAFDLEPAVRGAAEGFRTVSELHRIVVDVAAGLPPVLGDPTSVEPVVGQLLENALKYSPRGGEVRVVVRGGDGYAVVDVLDRGVGIPAGTEDMLFTRFFQAGPVDRREYAGMGLGLHIVRQLVEAQGGTVHAANREDGGARIGFTLPYAPAVPLPRAVPRDAAGVRPPRHP
ncbi:MAG: two-component system, OmpR family, phosphate regulon sensor histidine kinase PhoR [Frankiaceae bacterium]|jgi:signal transduction histidine kinase|nr:two-component system, OmpR family, phosphate regulon sensor histidine kinase PhoR [Frankiaceae bacterium]